MNRGQSYKARYDRKSRVVIKAILQSIRHYSRKLRSQILYNIVHWSMAKSFRVSAVELANC